MLGVLAKRSTGGRGRKCDAGGGSVQCREHCAAAGCDALGEAPFHLRTWGAPVPRITRGAVSRGDLARSRSRTRNLQRRAYRAGRFSRSATSKLGEPYPFRKEGLTGSRGVHISPRQVLSSEIKRDGASKLPAPVVPRRGPAPSRQTLPSHTAAADGETNKQIAVALGITCQKVARWRVRFCEGGRGGLEADAPGPGHQQIYGSEI